MLSPLLFNIYIADIDKDLGKRNIGGVAVGDERIWSLAYADDLVIIAKNRVALLDMMDTLRRFLRARELTLSSEKSKVLVFNRKGREKNEVWKWKEVIQEVNSFKYLGFSFNRDGNYKEHIKEMARKGRMAANKVWGLGERICKNDFCRRWTLFRYLVQSTIAYGVEIWGWEEKKELEKNNVGLYEMVI